MKPIKSLIHLTAVIVTLVTMTALPLASSAAQFLSADQAFVLRTERQANGDFSIRWKIAEGHYLYRDHTVVKANANILATRLSSGVEKDDPGFGKVSVWFANGEAVVSAAALATAGHPATVQVTYQGCEDGSICYPPVTTEVQVPQLPAATKTKAQAPDSVASSAPPELSLTRENVSETVETAPLPVLEAPAMEATNEVTAETAPANSLIENLVSQGGGLWVLLAFFGFGLLLAFTPCVFPMYPILAGVIGQDTSGTRRGFFLSVAYVLGLALAFAGLGFAAAWSGQNLQMVLQSSWAIGTLAIIFLVLAASMFGGFDLTLPRWWTECFGGTAKTGRRSLVSAGGMGFASALIVGPCVTAPLAGALLYIAQTGDAVLGAAALFSLGLGKGVPLVLFGTAGARFLPRAGAWMNHVKAAFGFVFVAMAWWLLSRILPVHIVMASGALMALAIAVALWRLSQSTVAALVVVSRALAVAVGVWGVFWLAGVASGASDPWRPLALAASNTTSGEEAPYRVAATVLDENTLAAALERSAIQGNTAVVYFTADWCVTCRAIEKNVLRDRNVRQALEQTDLLKVDVTSNDEAVRAIMARYAIVGPPTMLFIGSDGEERKAARLVGTVTADAVLEGIAGAGRTS